MGLLRNKALRREASTATLIPYTVHVDECIVRTKRGDYVQVFRLGGASFESADDEDINTWHDKLNVFWRAIASPNFSVTTHIIRRRDNSFPDGSYADGFAAALMEKYRRKVTGETLMVNELYVSLVYRPQPTKVGSAFLDALKRTSKEGAEAELADSIDICQKKRQELLSAFARYDVEALGIYEREGALHSAAKEFFAYLINAHWAPRRLSRGDMCHSLADTRPMFGNEAMEYRGATQTRLGAFLGISEYPSSTPPGLLDPLLTAPFPFVLTQSLDFISKSVGLKLLKTQRNRLNASEDDARSQIEELDEAMDDLVSNRFALGRHHFSLQVQADPFDGLDGAQAGRLRTLNDNIALAKTYLGHAGIVTAREDLAMEAAFWAQLPGNESLRPRLSAITSRNFAGLSAFHNYPVGRKEGNHWGPAATMFATTALSPYFYSLHASDPRKEDGGSRKDVAHTNIIGPTGTGKTVVIGFLIAALTRFGTRQVVFDNEEGLHILVRALGGRYRPLRLNQPTGCNPLQLEPSGANIEFMKDWLRVLVRREGKPLTVQQEQDLDQALGGVIALPERGLRRISRLMEFLDTTDAEGLHARLTKWSAAHNGDYAWVFDNPRDEIASFMDTKIVGFDVTQFLGVPRISEPLSMYLLHLTNSMVNGNRMVCWMDEFAQMIGKESFDDFAKHGLETWRRKEACFIAAAQMPSHVLDSDIARSIIEQTPTKIFFPNPEANHSDYVEGFNLSEREFDLIKVELEPGDRTFLIKQGANSIVVKLDLANFDFELDVISSRTLNVALMLEIIDQYGDDPKIWLPEFKAALERRKTANVKPVHEKELSHAVA